jgi:hypothetical protein
MFKQVNEEGNEHGKEQHSKLAAMNGLDDATDQSHNPADFTIKGLVVALLISSQ